MKRLRLTLVGAATALVAAALTFPVSAAVAPNGSFTFPFPGPNTTNTSGNIASTTTSLTVAGSQAIGSFRDPFLGSPDNLCGAAGNGCSAAHPPGFLLGGGGGVGSPLTNSLTTYPVGPVGSIFSVSNTVTATQGTANIDFLYTMEEVTVLVPTTATSAGSLTLMFTGTFDSNNNGAYTLGQSADESLACTQPANFGAISCSATLDTPSTIVITPEPASLAVLGSALVGLGFFRRRRKAS